MNYFIAPNIIFHFGSTNIIFVKCMYNLLSIQHFTNVQKYDYYLVSFSTKIIIYKRCFIAEKCNIFACNTRKHVLQSYSEVYNTYFRLSFELVAILIKG